MRIPRLRFSISSLMVAVTFVAIVAAQVRWMFPPGMPFMYVHGEAVYLSNYESYAFYLQLSMIQAVGTGIQVLVCFFVLRRTKKFRVWTRSRVFLISELIVMPMQIAVLTLFSLMKLKF